MKGPVKKAIPAMICLLLLLLSLGCGEEKTVPDPAVEAFLNTELSGEKAIKAVNAVSYTVTETRENKAGEELGRTEYAVTIDKGDGENLYLHILRTFSGTAVEDGITRTETTLQRGAEGYVYTTCRNEEVQTEAVDETFAMDYVNSFFFTDNGAYKEGGLYYGDFFLLYIYKYPATSFHVEGDTCVFDEKMEVYEGDGLPVLLHQRAVIDGYGLLQQEYERFESQEQDVVLVSRLEAGYEYKE